MIKNYCFWYPWISFKSKRRKPPERKRAKGIRSWGTGRGNVEISRHLKLFPTSLITVSHLCNKKAKRTVINSARKGARCSQLCYTAAQHDGERWKIRINEENAREKHPERPMVITIREQNWGGRREDFSQYTLLKQYISFYNTQNNHH